MPDHNSRPASTPPSLRDRVVTNVWSLVISAISLVNGLIILGDVIAGTDWEAWFALQFVPSFAQVCMSTLLVVGAATTTHGVLVRRGFLTEKLLCPLATIRMERLGWATLALAWFTVIFAVLYYNPSPSALTLVITGGIVVGTVVKERLLRKLEKDVEQEVRDRAETRKALRKVREQRE